MSVPLTKVDSSIVPISTKRSAPKTTKLRIVKRYTDEEIREIVELSANCSESEDFDNLWKK